MMYTYDDPESFYLKARFIKDNQLRGFSVNEVGGDFDGILHDVILSDTGFTAAVDCT